MQPAVDASVKWFVHWLLLLSLLCGLLVPAVQARELNSYAFVNDDGSLRVQGYTLYLYGIIIPPTETTCQTFMRPVRCGSRAALALDFKIGTRFVHCRVLATHSDGSLTAACSVDGTDLAAYLLRRGWAAAGPDAPPLYAVLERIARARGLGVWGTPVDRVLP